LNINDYLWAIRRRLWLPVLVPILAAAVTAGFIYLQPEAYQAQATVIVPALSAKGYSTSAVTQYVSTYKDVLTSAPVVAQVSRETGATKKDLTAGLSATTNTASSNIILVTYSSPKRSEVVPVAQAAATDSLDSIIGPQLFKAQSEVAATQVSLDVANQAIGDFTSKTGHLFPDVDYKIKSSELSALEVQLSQALQAKDKARVRFLQGVVAKRTADLVTLASQVIEYQGLLQARSGAETAHTKAVVDLNSVQAEMASDHAPGSVTVTFIGHVSRLPGMLRFGAVAFAVALLLSLGFIILLEFLRPTGSTLAYGSPLTLPRAITSRAKVPAAVRTLGRSEKPSNGDGNGEREPVSR
jgi:capsular polysaccharide biosynthesis protein